MSGQGKRKPTDPIPGFEDEFTGTVGHEKRIHVTHWSVRKKPEIMKTPFDTGFVWVKVGQVWKLKKKEEVDAISK